jgi:DNA sulfur modification protein DndE
MKPPVETIRLSAAARDRLIQMKRMTGIQHWNELCRWALCLSLGKEDDFPQDLHPDRNSVEMSWATFAGEYDWLITALVTFKWRQFSQNNPKSTISCYFHAALENGIAMLPRAIQNTSDKHLCSLSM